LPSIDHRVVPAGDNHRVPVRPSVRPSVSRIAVGARLRPSAPPNNILRPKYARRSGPILLFSLSTHFWTAALCRLADHLSETQTTML